MLLQRMVVSLLQVFSVFAFLVAGILFSFLPYLPEARNRLIHFILTDFGSFSLVGLAFFAAAFLLLIGFYGANKGRFLEIKMGGDLASIEKRVIRGTLKECFKTHFPKRISLQGIDISQGKLEVAIQIKKGQEEEREKLFLSVEKELKTLLKERFGYSSSFYLIVRVPSKKS